MLSIKKLLAKIIGFLSLDGEQLTYCAMYKRSGVCTMNINDNLPATADSAVLFTLASKYRPATVVDTPIYSTSGTRLGLLRIHPNGDVYPVFGALTAGSVRQAITYVVGGG